jgi:hypothetical protein
MSLTIHWKPNAARRYPQAGSAGRGGIIPVSSYGSSAVVPTGTGAITLGALGVAGTGTFTTPASGAITLGSLAAAGAATLTSTSSGSVTLAALSAAGSATSSAPGTTTGTGAVTLAALSASGSAAFATSATGSVTLAGLSVSGSGVLTTSATGSVTLAGLSASGSATSTAAGAAAGTGAITLGPLSVSGVATSTGGLTTGAGAVTLARLDRYRPPERHPPDRDGMMDLPIYLSMLSDVEREALTLRFRDGLTVASAASRLGLSTSAVVNATHRAIEKIRDRI